MTTAAERLVALAGRGGAAAALLLTIGSGATAGEALVNYSGLPSATAAQHLLADRDRRVAGRGQDERALYRLYREYYEHLAEIRKSKEQASEAQKFDAQRPPKARPSQQSVAAKPIEQRARVETGIPPTPSGRGLPNIAEKEDVTPLLLAALAILIEDDD